MRYRVKSEAFAIPDRQRNAVTKGVEKVVLAVAVSVADLIDVRPSAV
jgi:hypothetical protein